MKKGGIVALIAALLFMVLAFTMFDSSKIEFRDFEAAEKDKTVKVMGTWDSEDSYEYDVENNLFVFNLTDQKNITRKVIHHGSKPNNFELADMIVVEGTMTESGDFQAEHILTKCPSKYEGSSKEFQEKNKLES